MNLKKIFNKLCNRETISYLVFGAMTTAVCFISYAIFQRLLNHVMGRDASIMGANLISWVLAVAFAYITNKLFVFESKSFARGVLIKEIFSFLGARLFSLGFELAWMWFTSIYLGFNDKICKILGQLGIIAINYFFSKLFIFKHK